MNDDGLKLTTYFGERDRTDRAWVADALLALYGRREVAVSVLLRGAAGFGANHRLRADTLLTLSDDLPLVSVAVDRRERIEALLPEVEATKRRGLITLERARLAAGELEPVGLPGATKLTLYVGRRARVGGRPAYLAICEALHARGIAGATVLLGVDGTVDGARRRARLAGRNADVPLMIVAVGDGPRMAKVLPELGRMLPRPLATLERVRICKRDGERLDSPPVVAETDDLGMRRWQKLMVYGSEQARIGGEPQHLALVRRLRAAGARGATVVRGVWGFHGAHAPHGDRLLQLRRHVPVVTIVVDRPDAIRRSFGIVDELTRERGLVTCETVPALAALTVEGRRGGLRLARRG